MIIIAIQKNINNHKNNDNDVDDNIVAQINIILKKTTTIQNDNNDGRIKTI